MSVPLCVVFDVGKTNKKVLVFDQHYKVIHEKQNPFDEVTDDDGFRCDDLNRLTDWVLNTFQELTNTYGSAIRAVNVSAYGASLVHLGADGQPVTPLYNYLRDLPRDLHAQFFEQYGPVNEFCVQTASPDLGMLNSGLQLYWLKHAKPAIANQIHHSLHLPQYVSYLLTGQPVSEITSVGCHTALWDFNRRDYHSWTLNENLHSIRQTPLPSATAYPMASLTQEEPCYAGIGIHDSSAALVPYLKACAGSADSPFVLLSTGTWAVSMNPFNDEPLTPDELRQDCLCYLSCEGRQVKSSRLFAGNEHERQIRHLAEYFHKNLDYYRQVRYDRTLIQSLRSRFKKPAETQVTNLSDSPFVERNLNEYATYEEAYCQFMLDLVAQQVDSLSLAIGQTAIKTLFVDGGFSRNDVFMHLLAEAYPHLQVRASKVAQASALGAALVIHEYWNPLPFNAECIELMPYPASIVS
ncbi:FGGY-family carbohydrate kinase [Spirosoma soli]|uniref:FGGY-family carbohydrate kinase n=1 Tax=Spirosoma soli TaxID=1770529 RepID=A0ABW5MAK5_9BACT